MVGVQTVVDVLGMVGVEEGPTVGVLVSRLVGVHVGASVQGVFVGVRVSTSHVGNVGIGSWQYPQQTTVTLLSIYTEIGSIPKSSSSTPRGSTGAGKCRKK